MPSEQEDILAVLTRYVSPPNASAIWRQALRGAAASADAMTEIDREHVFANMSRSLALFLPAQDQEKALADLRKAFRLNGKSQRVKAFEIRLESDISIVRTEARRVAEGMGANGFAVQKVTTIVSELARNIVSYTEGGMVTLALPEPPNRVLTISAKDSGTGIPDIALVLSGAYRSKTGLGRGLLGCKRLADKFQIESGKMGTRVEVEVRL